MDWTSSEAMVHIRSPQATRYIGEAELMRCSSYGLDLKAWMRCGRGGLIGKRQPNTATQRFHTLTRTMPTCPYMRNTGACTCKVV